jgi:nicotinamidase-related amidase
MNDTPSSVALLLIDVINAFDFENCEPLVAAAQDCTSNIVELRARCRSANVPVIYVNDNFGKWRSDFRAIVAECSRPDMPGHQVSQALAPGEQDYFVLKPRHSAFYCTALELLLDSLGCRKLVIVGFATNICVLYTANDAHMRGYEVYVPADCTASNSHELTAQALEHLRLASRADTTEARALDLEKLRRCTR